MTFFKTTKENFLLVAVSLIATVLFIWGLNISKIWIGAIIPIVLLLLNVLSLDIEHWIGRIVIFIIEFVFIFFGFLGAGFQCFDYCEYNYVLVGELFSISIFLYLAVSIWSLLKTTGLRIKIPLTILIFMGSCFLIWAYLNYGR